MADNMGDGTAVLHLTVLSAQALKDFNFLGKTKTAAVAWVDPRHRKSTKTLHISGRNPIWNQTLLFPLSEPTLRDPSSRITVEVLCSSNSIVGSASLPLSAVQNDGEIFTVQLQKSRSARPRGWLTISTRIAWNCVIGVPVGGGRLTPEFVPPTPTAPPLPDPAPLLRENSTRNFLIGLISGAVAALIVGSQVV